MIGINPDCPPGIALLADHLDASLAAGEDLLASSLAARADLDEVDPQGAPEALDAFVQRLLQLESSLVLRLLQARRLSVEVARTDPAMKGAASLFRAQTDTLHDMIAGAGRSGEGGLARAGDSHAYIRSRGLIAPEAAAPSPFETLAVDENFRVGGVVQLSQILDFVSTTLDLLDVRFGLYMPDLPEDAAAASEPDPAPDASLGSILGRMRAVAADSRDDESETRAGETAFEVVSDGGEKATSKPDKADNPEAGPSDLAAAEYSEPPGRIASDEENDPSEEMEQPRKVDYRSLASLIAEVQRSADRLSGGPNNGS